MRKNIKNNIYGSVGATSGNVLRIVLVNGMTYATWSSQSKKTKMMLNLNMFVKSLEKLNREITNQFNEIS